MRIDHFNITAPMDLIEKVKEFYLTLFDLFEGPRPNFSRRGYWLYHKEGTGALIHLIETETNEETKGNGYLNHIAFGLDSLSGIVEKLESLGVKYRLTGLPDNGSEQIFFEDPAGTGIELILAN